MTEAITLGPDHAPLARAIAQQLEARFGFPPTHRATIGVAGESGSGKSVTALALARELVARGLAVQVLHQDDYFLLPPHANHEHRVLDLAHVGPHEVDLARLARHVTDFRAGRGEVEIPSVDHAADAFAVRRVDFARCTVLIVEGTYVLGLGDLDVRIFLEATHEDTRDRRRARNRDLDAPILDDILAIERTIIAPQVARADLVIDHDFEVRVSRA